MNRAPLQFLRPYLSGSFKPLTKPEHARVYRAAQSRFARLASTEAYTGPHDVEKQKRLDQLQKAKPLAEYHPRLVHSAGVETLTVRDFNSKYEAVQETQPDVVSVFGTTSLE